jgi:putative acetyltransferase
VGRAVLAHLLDLARDRRLDRVSLETGTTEGFAPARRLYESAGFAACPPFGSYRESPYSAFYTRSLGPVVATTPGRSAG